MQKQVFGRERPKYKNKIYKCAKSNIKLTNVPQFLECVHLCQTQNQLNMALLQVNILKEFNTDTYIKYEVTKTQQKVTKMLLTKLHLFTWDLFLSFTLISLLQVYYDLQHYDLNLSLTCTLTKYYYATFKVLTYRQDNLFSFIYLFSVHVLYFTTLMLLVLRNTSCSRFRISDTIYLVVLIKSSQEKQRQNQTKTNMYLLAPSN